MKRFLLLSLLVSAMPLGLVSCANKEERKVVGPTSTSSQIPWNRPIAGQGAGQMGAMSPTHLRR